MNHTNVKSNSVIPCTIKNPIRTVVFGIKLELLFWIYDIKCLLEATGEDGYRGGAGEGGGVGRGILGRGDGAKMVEIIKQR